MFSVFAICLLTMCKDSYYLFNNRQYLPSRAELVIFNETNLARVKNGLPPLLLDIKLCKAARYHACNMASARIMSHTLNRSTPSGRAIQFGYSNSVGENIAYGYDCENVVKVSWLRSPPHRANILSAGWLKIGIGSAANATEYHCQLFGN